MQAPKGLRRYTMKQSSAFRSVHNSPSKKEELEFAKEVGLHNFENDGSEEDVSAEHLENNEFERSSLRETFSVDKNKKDNESETYSINMDNRKENDIETNNEEHPEDVINSEENDMNYAGEVQQEEREMKSSEVVGIESNLREEIIEDEKIESGQLDPSSEDDNIVESGQMECFNENDEHEYKSEPEEIECSSEDLVKKIMVQDVKCELSGFEEESNSETLSTSPLGKEERELAETANENKENVFEEKLRDYKPKIEEDNKMKDYLEDGQEIIGDKKANLKSSTKKRSKSLAKFTPPLSKLRPRTPCSRSTRRSLMAHCNSSCLGDHRTPMTTPLSRRKKSKRSLTVIGKIELDSEPSENLVNKAIPEINTGSKTPSQIPEEGVLKSKLVYLIEINFFFYG